MAIVIILVCLLMKKKSTSLKLIIKCQTPTLFCVGSISEKCDAVEYREVSFKKNLYDFSVDYNAIEKCDILNIHMYLMV